MTGLAALCLAGSLGAALFLLLIARATGWRRRRIGVMVRPWLLAMLILLTIGLAGEMRDGIAGLSRAGWVVCGAWLGVSLAAHWAGRGSRDIPVRRWGARAAHAGVAIAIGGMLMAAGFASSGERAMAAGDTIQFSGRTLQLHEIWPAAGEGWTGVAAELRLSGGDGVVTLKPEWRTMFDGAERSQPATLRSGAGALTARLGPRDPQGRWLIRLVWTPLLVLIPIGLWVSALGCAVAMAGPAILRQRRLRRYRLATAWWA